jgi:hypothetical protein
MPKKLHFYISYDRWYCQNIFVPKKKSHSTKNCKYTQEMIEMIFNVYEICRIY